MTYPLYVLKPVGWVESPLINTVDAPSQGGEGAPEAWLVFQPEIYEAVRDVKVGDKVIVIT